MQQGRTTDRGDKEITNSTETAWVILNGPSASQFEGLNPHPLVGCNYAYKDWNLDHCVAVDRMCVHNIRKDPHPDIDWITKAGVKIDTPQGWRLLTAPGVDSGTLAIEVALELAPRVIVMGADGIMNGSNKNRYYYHWHPKGTRPGRHGRFRKTAIELNTREPNRIWFAWDSEDSELQTMPMERVKQEIINSQWQNQS
jgi:hypothetical protein